MALKAFRATELMITNSFNRTANVLDYCFWCSCFMRSYYIICNLRRVPIYNIILIVACVPIL